MAISTFLPTDDRKVWINQLILTLPKDPIESGKRRVMPIRFGAV